MVGEATAAAACCGPGLRTVTTVSCVSAGAGRVTASTADTACRGRGEGKEQVLRCSATRRQPCSAAG